MLLPLAARRLYYDLAGPDDGPVVCFTHSLSSDSGMWAEQLPPLLAAGFRVLRVDMRGHGGSDPVEGDYTMDQLAGDVASVIEALGMEHVREKMHLTSATPQHERAAFMREHALRVVRGPGGALHVIDHHHWARAWHELGIETAPVGRQRTWSPSPGCSLNMPYDCQPLMIQGSIFSLLVGNHWIRRPLKYQGVFDDT